MDQEIKKIIEEFLTKTSFDFSLKEICSEDGGFWVSLETSDSHTLIGRNGETLQSLNYLLRRIIETKYKDEAPRVTLDVNEYQKQKIEKVKTMAHMMAERARFFKSSIELPPMNAFERRVVHDFVSQSKDISSASQGFGPERHVVISFVKDSNQANDLPI